jgi:ketosteroid isomerase-like protein
METRMLREAQTGDLKQQYPDLPADVRHRNVALVEKMYECFNKGDMDTIKSEVFAPDLKWALPGRNPVGGVKNGADEVIAFFAALARSTRGARRPLSRSTGATARPVAQNSMR